MAKQRKRSSRLKQQLRAEFKDLAKPMEKVRAGRNPMSTKAKIAIAATAVFGAGIGLWYLLTRQAAPGGPGEHYCPSGYTWNSEVGACIPIVTDGGGPDPGIQSFPLEVLVVQDGGGPVQGAYVQVKPLTVAEGTSAAVATDYTSPRGTALFNIVQGSYEAFATWKDSTGKLWAGVNDFDTGAIASTLKVTVTLFMKTGR